MRRLSSVTPTGMFSSQAANAAAGKLARIAASAHLTIFTIDASAPIHGPQFDAARQLGSGVDPRSVPNYLLDVDHPLVVPAGKKVRILLTAGDVIHAWWVPAFGMKKDAIPGFVNELWFRADQVGIYRGQCAELCGRDHGFMPVVVDVRSQADYDSWLKEQQDGIKTASAAE